MKSFKNIFVWVIPLSFVLGTWWGFRLVAQKQAPVDAELRALAYAGTLPDETLTALVEKKKMRIQFDWVKTPDEWYDKITSANKTYDLVFSYHFHTELLAAQKQLIPLDTKTLQNLNRVAVDFIRMPFNDNSLMAVPLLWGAMGFIYDSKQITSAKLNWQTLWAMKADQKIALRAGLYSYLSSSWQTLQKQKQNKKRRRKRKKREDTTPPAYVTTSPLKELLSGRAWVSYITQSEYSRLRDPKDIKFAFGEDHIPYWVYTVAVSKQSRNPRAAQQAIDHLIGDDLAHITALKGRYSSTHLAAEKLKGYDHIKPSQFRKLSLTQLHPAESHWLF